MPSMTTIARLMQQAISAPAERHAHSSAFIQRQRTLTASAFCEALVFGWLQHPAASVPHLARMLVTRNVTMSVQGLDRRFTPAAARLLYQVLLEVVATHLPEQAPVSLPLLQRFTAVYLDDSSIVRLPDALTTTWQGAGGTSGPSSAVKLQVRLDLSHGHLAGPYLQHGRGPDTTAPMHTHPVLAGSLRVADLGYFSLPYLAHLAANRAFFLSRLHPQTTVTIDGVAYRPAELPVRFASVDEHGTSTAITLGARQQIPCHLLVRRVPAAVAAQRRQHLRQRARERHQQVSETSLALADWTIMVTNADLTVTEATELLAARWQIELLFRQWKMDGQIDEWRSRNPWRILCELYAKLIAQVLSHWIVVAGCWQHPDRSLVKAAQVVRDHAICLALAFSSTTQLARVIRTIHRCFATGCRQNPRRRKPATYQRLAHPAPST
jgi:Transposase DDE domain